MPDPVALNLARLVHRLLVDPRGWRVDQLMEELEIRPRTYRKYRTLLRDHFEHRIDPSGRWRIVEVGEGTVRYLRLRPDDGPAERAPGFLGRVAAYWLVRDVFRFAGGGDIAEAFEDGWEDLLDGVEDKSLYLGRLLRNTDRMLHFVQDAPKDYSGHEETISTLLSTLFFVRKVRFTYASGDGSRLRTSVVCPLTLVMWRSALYLVGVFEPGGKAYVFAVDRMRDVRSEGERFAYPSPDDYNPARLFEGSFGIWQDPDATPTDVELLFADQPWLHRYLRERTWHPSQSFEELDDGRLRMIFTVTTMVEVWPWVRQFGDDVEVVRPVAPVKGTESV